MTRLEPDAPDRLASTPRPPHRGLGPDPDAALDRRYRRKLVRYARSILGRSVHDAEDIVQDVLLQVTADRQAGREPDDLGPWLYRLTRNRAIDELRRARWGDASLDATTADGDDTRTPTDTRTDPSASLARRESLQELLSDLADLPVRQRSALLATVVDGESTRVVASRLGVSVEATQMLVTRARRGLVHARDARQADIARLDQRLHALAAPSGILAAIGLAQFASVGTKLAVAGIAAIGSAAAVAGAVIATGGVSVVSTNHVASGKPSTISIASAPTVSTVGRGGALPPGTSIVSALVHVPQKLPGKPEPHRTVTLTCPAGQRFSSLLITGIRSLHASYLLSPHTIQDRSQAATIDVFSANVPNARGTLAILCRHHDDPRALAASTTGLRPLSATDTTIPDLKGRIVVHRATAPFDDPVVRVGQLFVTLRLTRPPARGHDGWALLADASDGDVHHLVDADYATTNGHCFQYQSAQRITTSAARRGVTIRLWIGDGHGGARLISQHVAIPPPVRRAKDAEPSPRDQPTWKLGCWSRHL